MGNERVSTDLPGDPGGHENDSSVNDSAQRRQMPFSPRERGREPSEQRHIPDWIDRRPKGRKILADFD